MRTFILKMDTACHTDTFVSTGALFTKFGYGHWRVMTCLVLKFIDLLIFTHPLFRIRSTKAWHKYTHHSSIFWGDSDSKRKNSKNLFTYFVAIPKHSSSLKREAKLKFVHYFKMYKFKKLNIV